VARVGNDAEKTVLYRRQPGVRPSALGVFHGEDGYSGFMMRDPETGQEKPTELNGILKP
jgi:hypothetical protein